MTRRARARHRRHRRPGAGRARRLGDDRPHLARPAPSRPPARPGPVCSSTASPGGLQPVRRPPGQPRGDDPGHLRQRPPAQPPGAGHRGRRHPPPARRRADDIYDAAVRTPTRACRSSILAGKEYGSGSSRDWAAKGTALLGVRAVIAECYERIHRSNLIGMGVLPLQFLPGESAGLARPHRRGGLLHRRPGRAARPSRPSSTSRRGDAHLPGPGPHRHAQGGRVLRHGGVLLYVLRQLASKERPPPRPSALAV